jgi:mono/diheme cytochrome c family protein
MADSMENPLAIDVGLMERAGWIIFRLVTLCLAIAYRALRNRWIGVGWVVFMGLWAAALEAGTGARLTPPVDFNRQIRPILSEHCFACHGPDEGKRKAGLRLDRQEDAFLKLKSGQYALVAGKPESSTLVERILTKDPDEIMPPPQHGKPLTAAQIDLLQQWVRQGAAWQQHWSFIAPTAPELPRVQDGKWARNAIDAFVLSRLESEGIKPNPEADPVSLQRRVTLDLTGLPPTVEEVDAFLADKRSDAYERLVDRLMESRHYGERLGQNWLDLARYADTSGYHFDGVRFMWLWRDWVIDAFNADKPFNEFTVEQLAGDLLPNPTVAQRVATGFVRNNMTNDEGGADPDEYLNKYVVDRVNTLGATFMGLTVGCTECHDHKYDPISAKEFYQLYAFFHNVPEKGLDRIRTDNPPPRLPVPTAEQAAKFVEADFALKDAEKTLQDRTNELGETQEKWERELGERPLLPPSTNGVAVQWNFDGVLDPAFVWKGTNAPEFADARLGKALKLDGKAHAEAASRSGWDRTNAFAVAAWVRIQGDGALLSQMEKGPGYRGVDLLVSDRRLQTHLIQAWPDDAIKVRTKEQLPQNQWLHVAVSYDGSAKASGVQFFVNGVRKDLETEKDQLKGTFATSEPLRIGSRNGESYFSGQSDDVRIYSRALTATEAQSLTFEGYAAIVAKSRGKRSDEERNELARFYRENHAVDYLRAEKSLAQARRNKDAFYSKIPTTLIMEELDPPRETYVLVRGDFRTRGQRVQPGTPAFLPPLPAGPTNRLTLARWLVSKEHPLTARVTVNRYWAMLFGNGLVKTANDFGSQGEWPSHPELLDFLATRFRDGGLAAATPQRRGSKAPQLQPWGVKGLLRLMVTSSTYRQAATATPEKLTRDPYNRLFTRGPRLRLDAEYIRDNALAVSGLLNPKIGGASVKPYQPPGIWDGTDSVFVQDHGQDLYRRGMYVFWRRSAHYPSFATFDAPNREVCTFLRQRTQTPLQSLVLMNDPAFVEAARGLAQRVLKEEPTDLDRRLVRAFRHTLGRKPQPDEVAVLKQTHEQQLARFIADPAAAKALIAVGESKAPESSDPAALAAMTAVANVLLNLNETITK